jgi:hypothetical protein
LVIVFFVFKELISLTLPDVNYFAVLQSDIEVIADSWWHIDFESLHFPFDSTVLLSDISSEKLSGCRESVLSVAPR